MCLKDPWSWPAAILLFLLPLWCWEMLPHVGFSVFLHLFRNFGLLFPFSYHGIYSICGFLYPVSLRAIHVQYRKQSLFPQTTNWFSFSQVFFFPESSWPHLSHKWSLLIRARTWWASNLIFADNSFSTSGICWLVWCSVGFGLFLRCFFSSPLPVLEFLLQGKVCLDGFISCGEVGF